MQCNKISWSIILKLVHYYTAYGGWLWHMEADIDINNLKLFESKVV